jgi:hypothetical protein
VVKGSENPETLRLIEVQGDFRKSQKTTAKPGREAPSQVPQVQVPGTVYPT